MTLSVSPESTHGRWCVTFVTRVPRPAFCQRLTLDVDSLVAKAKAAPSIVGRDLVQEVTCEEALHLG